jgi:hypothetical protein
VKRRTSKLVLFLLALLVGGAMINVAVAWAFAFDLEMGARHSVARVDNRYWGISRTESFGSLIVTSQIWSGGCRGCDLKPLAKDLFPTWFSAEALWLRESLPEHETTILVSSGFPFHALWGMQTSGPPFYLGVGFTTIERVGISVSRYQREVLLPVRPLFPGFAINTIFYAAVLWMLFAVPGAVRRRVRRTRGQCASCGYSLRGHGHDDPGGKCPECGANSVAAAAAVAKSNNHKNHNHD